MRDCALSIQDIAVHSCRVMVTTGGNASFRVLCGLAIHGGHSPKTGRTTTSTSISVGGFVLVQGFRGEEDGSVEAVGETTMATTELHGDDDEFGDDSEFAHEGGVDTGVAHG